MASTFWRAPTHNQRLLVPLVALLTVGASCALYTADPDGLGQFIFVAAASVCVVAILVGPYAHGITSIAFILLPGSAALAFLVSLATRSAPPTSWITHARLADAASFTGYWLLAMWLRQLSRKHTPRKKYEAWLDSLMVATGASIIFWSLAIAPSLPHGSLSLDTVMLALYPAFDVVLITLTAQLIYRIGTPNPAMAWFLMAVSMLLIVDSLYTVVWWTHPGLSVPALSAWYLFTYAWFALGLCHPSVVALEHGSVGTGRHRRTHRHRVLALVFSVLPSVACVAFPTHGLLDTVVRVVLIVVAIALVYARLEYALRLSERAEDHIRQQAHRDPLTGLGNRLELAERFPQALRDAADDNQVIGVLLLDLDGFKRINDTWGHSFGDETLQAVALRLQVNTPWALFVVRLGGDEFLVCTQEGSQAAVVQRADDVRALFDEAITLSRGPTVSIAPSIGISAVAPYTHPSADEILREADVALYHAKRHARSSRAVYEGAVRETDQFQRGLINDLAKAIHDRALSTAFQPIVSATDPYPIRGWEALARWHHPEHGFINPKVFIAVAEQHGLLDDVLHLIIRDATDFVRRRNSSRATTDPLQWVSINVTPAQILGAYFVPRLLDQCRHASVPPAWLRLEITETALMPGDEMANDRLQELRAAGVGVFLDDFGTGFAGIGILRHLQFDAVKIDRSFIRSGWNDANLAAFRGIMDLARGLSIRSVIAEGVETAEDARRITELGIELGQGWFYGPPTQPTDCLQTEGLPRLHPLPN